ncbi:MAG TPA: Nramp family divalent metal transporter [Acidimicrobiia bacterium]|nr:Nramp family divalent metal transporter [Acidimicrobiia bacterium]
MTRTDPTPYADEGPIEPGSKRDDASHRTSPSGWRAYMHALGPGLITGASDDDPSGVATYAQAGAQFKYGLLWTSLMTFPLMAGVQEICDRTALATGESLGALARRRFGTFGRAVVAVLLGALLLANVLNIAADLVAVGAGAQLLNAGPQTFWAVGSGIGITVLVMTGSFDLIARVFKVLASALLAYLGVIVFAHVDWSAVAGHTLVPHVQLSKGYIALLIATLGTTISPYLFFWQSAHRIEDLRREPEGGDRPEPLPARSRSAARLKQRTSRLDVGVGMAFSNIVMFSIIVATASTLGKSGSVNIDSAAQAAAALRPFAGGVSTALFAVGLIGAGFLAIPVLAGSAAAGISGLVGRRWGFSRSPRDAPIFYVLVAVGTLGGAALSLLGVNPIALLVVVAMVNGLAAAPFLVVVMLIAGNRRLMGDYVNGRLAATIGWLTVAVMGAAAIALVVTQ